MSSRPELTPIETATPKVSAPPSGSGGLPAIFSATKHALTEMGPIRGTMELLKANQRGGFDCPGCAWPDPDDRREMVEFCDLIIGEPQPESQASTALKV